MITKEKVEEIKEHLKNNKSMFAAKYYYQLEQCRNAHEEKAVIENYLRKAEKLKEIWAG